MPWSSVRTRRGSYDVQLDALIQCLHKERKFNMMFNWMPWTRFCIKCGIHSWVHWSSLCTRTIHERRFNRMFSSSLDTGWAQGERSDMAFNWVSWCRHCLRRGRLMSCSAGCHNAVCVTALKSSMLFNMVNLKCWVRWRCEDVHRGSTWCSSGHVDIDTLGAGGGGIVARVFTV